MTVKKLAVFVEGQTEAIFLEKFMKDVAGEKRITLRTTKRYNKRKLAYLSELQAWHAPEDIKHAILIVDCAGDEQVKSAILEALPTLTRQGYSQVLGLRDFYPRQANRLAATRAGLHYGIPTKGVPVHITLAVQEVEAWFAQECSHFSRVDPKLDLDAVAALGFDPRIDCADKLSHPSAFLNSAYKIVGKKYSKSRKHVLRTVNALDSVEMYISVPQLLTQMVPMLARIDNFLSVDDL